MNVAKRLLSVRLAPRERPRTFLSERVTFRGRFVALMRQRSPAGIRSVR